MDEFLSIAIIAIIAGAIQLIWVYAAQKRRVYSFIGVGIMLFGVAVAVLQNFAPNYTLSFITFAIGAVIWGAAINLMVGIYSCRERVSAVMIDYGMEQYKAHITSSPVFAYRYNGKDYEARAAECFSQRYVLKHYKIGEAYTIYLRKKDPSFIKMTRRVRMLEIVLFIIGLTCMSMSLIECFL